MPKLQLGILRVTLAGVHSGLQKRSHPTLSPPLPRTSLRRSSASSTLRAPQSEKGKAPPEPPWARPPRTGSLGWIWALGTTAHFSGTRALPPAIPHKGTKLGMGWSYQTHTHTRTGSETKGKNKAQLVPLKLHRLNHHPFGVWGSA